MCRKTLFPKRKTIQKIRNNCHRGFAIQFTLVKSETSNPNQTTKTKRKKERRGKWIKEVRKEKVEKEARKTENEKKEKNDEKNEEKNEEKSEKKNQTN